MECPPITMFEYKGKVYTFSTLDGGVPLKIEEALEAIDNGSVGATVTAREALAKAYPYIASTLKNPTVSECLRDYGFEASQEVLENLNKNLESVE